MPDKEGNDAEVSQDTRKRRRMARGSQTDDEPSKSEESNLPNTRRNKKQTGPCFSWYEGNLRAYGKAVPNGERKL